MTQLAERVTTLEDLMEMLVQESLKTEMGFQRLQEERQASDRKMEQYLADSDRNMKEFKAQMQQAREDSDRKMEQYLADSERNMKQFQEKSDRKMEQYLADSDRKMEQYLADSDRKMAQYLADSDRKMKQYLADSERNMKQFQEKSDRDMKQFQEKSDRDMKQFQEKSDRDMKQFQEKSDRNMTQFQEKSDQNMKQYQEKSDRNMTQFQEKSDRNMKQFQTETQKKIDDFQAESLAIRRQMWKQWGDLANKMGTIVEDIVAPGLRGIGRQYFQIDEFDYFAPRVRLRRENRSRTREFDVVAYSPEYFFLVETKSSGRTNYISEFMKLIPEIPSWFPLETKGRKLVPVFASLYLDDAAITYLTKNKILAMATRDDGMDIYNPEVIERL